LAASAAAELPTSCRKGIINKQLSTIVVGSGPAALVVLPQWQLASSREEKKKGQNNGKSGGTEERRRALQVQLSLAKALAAATATAATAAITEMSNGRGKEVPYTAVYLHQQDST
jgi:hypothetical protein